MNDIDDDPLLLVRYDFLDGWKRIMDMTTKHTHFTTHTQHGARTRNICSFSFLSFTVRLSAFWNTVLA